MNISILNSVAILKILLVFKEPTAKAITVILFPTQVSNLRAYIDVTMPASTTNTLLHLVFSNIATLDINTV